MKSNKIERIYKVMNKYDIYTLLKGGKEKLFSIPKGRIDWIDMAKGIAIILVIIGHTVKFGSGTRNFIYSFHMPLFFLLSGYTYKIAENREEFLHHLKIGCRHLLFPYLIISIINVIASWWQGSAHDILTLWKVTSRMGDALWWASACNVRVHPGIGAIWFLCSLFWAKIFIDSIHLLFRGKYTGYIFPFLGLAGMAIGVKGKWLPQNIDVTLVAIFFVYLGMLWKKYYESIEKYSQILFLVAISFWISCLYYDIYISMAERLYPFYLISVIEAVCGSFAICCLCKALAQNVYIKTGILFIGMHTLLILLVHQVDWIGRSLWQTESYWMTCAMRVIMVLGIAFFLHIARYYLRKVMK